MKQILLSLLLLLLLNINPLTSNELPKKSEQTCLELGFDSVDLRCDTCILLAHSIGEQARKDCEDCCTAPASKAIISVMRQDALSFPGLVEFFRDRHKKLESRIELIHPKTGIAGKVMLMLKNDKGDVVSEVEIQSWKASDLEEFLRASLPAMP
jgi:hypothetical protein